MRTEVPKKVIITCDVCRKPCEGQSYRMSSILNMERAGLDYQGCAVGPGGYKYDLCDHCSHQITITIEQMMKAAK